MFKPITTSQFIDITTSGSGSNKYTCKVKDILGERLVAIMPEEFTDFDEFIPGSKVLVSYSDSSAVYSFRSEIIIIKPGNPSILTIGKPINMTRIQRRNFVRLAAKLKVFSNKIDEENKGFSATSMDISGGGILLACDTQVTVGDTLEIKISIDSDQNVTAVGSVVRVTEQSASSKYRYSVGVEFKDIKEKERDKIIKYIFNQQRELRTKGLL